MKQVVINKQEVLETESAETVLGKCIISRHEVKGYPIRVIRLCDDVARQRVHRALEEWGLHANSSDVRPFRVNISGMNFIVIWHDELDTVSENTLVLYAAFPRIDFQMKPASLRRCLTDAYGGTHLNDFQTELLKGWDMAGRLLVGPLAVVEDSSDKPYVKSSATAARREESSVSTEISFLNASLIYSRRSNVRTFVYNLDLK